MPAADTTLDYRSLTLPKLKIKIKFKKPRKPTFSELLYLGLTITDTIYAVLNFLSQHYIRGAEYTILAGCYWKAYLYEREKNRFKTVQWVMIPLALVFSFIFIPDK